VAVKVADRTRTCATGHNDPKFAWRALRATSHNDLNFVEADPVA
jgi:hypothetical protein